MQKITKRMLSLLLTIVMVFSLLPPVWQASAATADTEAASDMLASATYSWSSQDWSGSQQLSYANDSSVTNGENSLRSWRFSTTAKTSSSYARLQLSLNKSYDMTGKDLVFDVKADPCNALTSYSVGIVPYGSDWKPLHDINNYQEIQTYFTGDGWHTVTVDNSILKAYLESGKDLSSVYVLYLSFYFPGGDAQNIYIDNMRLVDHNYGTDAEDAAADLLANAEVVENGANGSTYIYEHKNTTVAYGNKSNSSHKYAAAANAADMFTVKYDLGKSYDLNNKNIVLDILSYRGGNGFAFSLYNSQNQLVSYSESYTTVNQWAQVRPAILAGVQSGKNLSDVRYIAIGPRFATNTTRADRAFYVDNVRIENIDVYSTPLQNKNIVFMGDSITAAYGYKGWAGELQEHYRINPYNIGVGGASFATLANRTTIYEQISNIPNTSVDFFVLNGGVNDIWSKADLGAVNDVSVDSATVDSFDTDTTAGAMEQMFCYLRENHPNAQIAFILNYICYSTEIDGVRFRDEFAPLAKAICEKWGITCVDLTDNTEINALRGVHTYDGVHGNDVGYELVMRELAPALVGLCRATEQTEQNSDLLAYATYSWSAETWSGNLSYSNSCTDVSGNLSTRSWKFTAGAGQTANAGIQLMLSNLGHFTLTGKKLSFDVKFESSNGNSAQNIGLRLYDKNWRSVTGDASVFINGNGSDGWQTVTVDAVAFENLLADGCNLDEIMLVYFQFNFADNAGNTQNVYIDNFHVISETATDATEKASDLLYGASLVGGTISGTGMGYDPFNTTFLHGADSKYSCRFFIEDDKTAWATATFMLPQSVDLTESTLQFNVNQYNQVALWVDLFDSNNKQVTSDNYTLRDIGWQTYEINALYGLADGRTAEDLADIRYIRFSFNFDPANTGRTVVIDNLSTYQNEQYSSMAAGLTGLYLGDSISEAHNYKGWPGEMAEHYGINGYNVSVGGRTLANDGIFSELANAPADVNFDFVMLNGGVNDHWSPTVMGEITAEGTTSFDGTTPIGGLEKLFYTISTKYPNAEVFYILNYVPAWNTFQKDAYLNEFVPRARQACEKWGVHLLDLVDNDAFLAEFDVTSGVHTFDGLHPNKEGFDIITPYVVSWLEEVMCVDAKVRYQQLSLSDDLAMRYDLAVSAAYAQTATVTVTVDGVTVVENVSYNSLPDGMTGCKKLVLDMATAQMTDAIVISVLNGSDVLVEETYSVCDYVKNLIDGQDDEKTKELATAVLNYGAAAQKYFDHNANTPANAGYESTQTVEIPEVNCENMISGEVSGINFHGASLVYESQVAIRYYFAVSGNIADYTFSIGSEPVLKDDLYYVEVAGVNPQDYSNEIALTVTDGSSEMTVTYSPMYYIIRMHSKSSNAKLKALLEAMYQYHIAAVNYVTQETVRGEAFTGKDGKIIYLEPNAYENVTFDYKLTNDGTIRVLLRDLDAWVKGVYGDFYFNATGETRDYAGITCETLSDGYIRVTMKFAELSRTGLADNRDSAPEKVGVFDIYSGSTGDGYIDNIQMDTIIEVDPETPTDPDVPTEPEIPDVPAETTAFTAGAGKFVVVDTAYESISFEYKLDGEGVMGLILRDNQDWLKYYGGYYFNNNGESVDYEGVTTEILGNGYIRVTLNFAELTVTSANGAPENVEIFDIYGGYTTVNGNFGNVVIDASEVEEPTEPEIPPVPTETTAFTAGTTKYIVVETTYKSITFDYQLEGEGMMGVILRDNQDWTKYYGGYYFNNYGESIDYEGVTTEVLGNGYIRVTLNFAELTVVSANGAPENVEIFDIYGTYTTANGNIGNVKVDS